jgi:hypothetical protein
MKSRGPPDRRSKRHSVADIIIPVFVFALGVGFLYFGYDYIKGDDWEHMIFVSLFILGFVAALVYAMRKLSTINQPQGNWDRTSASDKEPPARTPG